MLRSLGILGLLIACGAIAISCKREQRSFHVAAPLAEMSESVPFSNWVRPGPITPGTVSTSQPVSLDRQKQEPFGSQYPQNAQALSDGQTLYESFNCSGCHAHGGGGMAPPLIDEKWFYGGDPQSVYTSIVMGRPNGMPSFRGRIPDYQVWELTAYVRSISGQANPNAAPGREDHMATTPPPNSMPKESPVNVPSPTTGPSGGQPTTQPSTKPTTQPGASG